MSEFCNFKQVFNFLNSIEGSGYGGMAEFEIARETMRVALSVDPCEDCDNRGCELFGCALKKAKRAGAVTESIYNGSEVIIPLADVQHIEKHPKNHVPGVFVIMKNTKWNLENGVWDNAPWISEPEATQFIAAWCRYRSELEADTLADLSPDSIMAKFDSAIEAIKAAP